MQQQDSQSKRGAVHVIVSSVSFILGAMAYGTATICDKASEKVA